MKRFIAIFIISITGLAVLLPSISFTATVGRFDDALSDATNSVQSNIDITAGNGAQTGAEGISNAIIYMVTNIITPLMIVVGVLTAILGFYEIFTNEKDDGQEKGMKYILWGVIGIVVMVSANFLASTLINGGIFVYSTSGEFLGNITAQRIYERLMFPFIKFAMYLVLGVLFIMVLFRTIGMIMDPKEDNRKKAITIIQRNAIGIIVIIFSKAIIETIYGQQAQVVSSTTTNLGQVGSGILADKGIPYVYTIINYIIGFIGLILLVIIIFQAVQLLTNPTDDGVQKKMRKNMIYIVIGLILIGTSYVVTNFLIAN